MSWLYPGLRDCRGELIVTLDAVRNGIVQLSGRNP
jgi:hypothetical protein